LTKDEFLTLPLQEKIIIALDNITFAPYLDSNLKVMIVKNYCNILDKNNDIIISYKFMINPGFDKVFSNDVVPISELISAIKSYKVILWIEESY